jgi:DNA-binding winged helix-turn-helix (wHTH) protein
MTSKEIFAFGPFELVVGRRDLLLRGEPVQIGPRAFDLLLALVRRQGELVTKDHRLTEIWAGAVVEENNLHVQVSALRRVLQQSGDDMRYLQTIPNRGYVFIAAVQRLTVESASQQRGVVADAVKGEVASYLPKNRQSSCCRLPI